MRACTYRIRVIEGNVGLATDWTGEFRLINHLLIIGNGNEVKLCNKISKY